MTLSLNTLRSLHARESRDFWAILITMTHDAFDAPMRIVNDTREMVSRGETYYPLPMDITLPADENGVIRRVQLTMDNIEYRDVEGKHRRITEIVRTLVESPIFTVEIVRSSEPDDIVERLPDLEMQATSSDQYVVSGALYHRTQKRNAFPAHRFTQKIFPGLY